MTPHDPIVVGVDGSDGSKSAVRWAAREADHLGLRLRLVHVFNDYVPGVGFYAAVYGAGARETSQVAESILQQFAADALPFLPEASIDTVAVRGDRRLGLLQAAADADVMVLGDEPHPAHHRLITGSIVVPIAAHSPVPVVVVPAGPHPGPDTSVVVGVKSWDSTPALVRQAVQVAASRKASLTVLHAWEYARGVDELFDDYELPDGKRELLKDLTRLVEESSASVADVDVEVRIVHGQPARVLVEASAGARLLVIGRRPHGVPFGHLGGTGRAVLRESRCPTMVLPPHAEPIQPSVARRE